MVVLTAEGKCTCNTAAMCALICTEFNGRSFVDQQQSMKALST